MPRLPRVTARQIMSVLEKAGFALVRQSGSHLIYKLRRYIVEPRLSCCCEEKK